jgi:hypothetical protein
MCEPVTMGIALGAMAVSGGLQAYGQYQSSKFEEEQAGANARLAGASAADATTRGAANAAEIRAQGTRALEDQKLSVATGGVDTASAASLFAGTRQATELDSRTATYNASLEAWGHNVEKEQYLAQRRMAKRQSVLGPLSSLVGTGAQMAALSYSASAKGKGK